MVTDAGGTIGSELCRQLLANGARSIVAIDINENGLYLLERQVNHGGPARLQIQVADIRDARRMDSLVARFQPQDIFHAAAHKHVPLMEGAPCEAVKNNVAATHHLLRAAQRHSVECFTFISSDKAVNPTSVMGATKRIGEMMMRAVSARSSVRACAVRFGNVIGSDGSVVPLFKQQIAAGGPVTVTDPAMRRYFMTASEAVGLVLRAARGSYGELCVLNMGEPMRILDLAHQMIRLAGSEPNVDIPVVITGLRPGEKLDEQVTDADETLLAAEDSDIRVVRTLAPPPRIWTLVSALEQAAAREDETGVISLLERLVPSYRRELQLGQLSA